VAVEKWVARMAASYKNPKIVFSFVGNNGKISGLLYLIGFQIMVKIRLSRGGAKKHPFYHIVVADSRKARDGRSIERLGFFNPVARGQEERLRLNLERVDYWTGVGAQVSGRVKTLVSEARSQAA